MRQITPSRFVSTLLRGAPLLVAAALAFDATAGAPIPSLSPDLTRNRAQDLAKSVPEEAVLAAQSSRPAPHGRLIDLFGKLPLSFEANKGQADPRVRYLSRGTRHTLFLTDSGAVLAWRAPPSPTAGPATAGALRMRLHGSNPRARAEGAEPLATRSHYLTGNEPSRWRTAVPHYGKVRYREVYPGIDLVFHGSRRQLEFDFVVAPGARLEDIRMGFEGAERLELDAQGNLIATTAGGEVVIHAPLVLQPAAAPDKALEGRFVLRKDRQIGFEVAGYDGGETLVIDPVLSFSTFFGGTDSEETNESAGIAVGEDGSLYIAGTTLSFDLPTLDPFQESLAGGADSFVAKLDLVNATIVYTTYLGGSDEESSRSLAVDAAGSATVVGNTASADFPTVNALQPALGGGVDAFVVKLDPTGSSLYYATYLGGSALDDAHGVSLDALGNAYVLGTTASMDFPTASPLQPANAGGLDVFVAKLNPTGSTLIYSTYLGGTGNDSGSDIATDPSGAVYGTGTTRSADFPTVNAFQSVYGGEGAFMLGDAFVFKLTVDGSTLAYSSYLGGSGDDVGQSIAVDTLGNAHVSGATSSLDLPTVNPLQGAHAGGFFDSLVAKFDTTGLSPVYVTYLGASGAEFGHGIDVDSLGNAYVAGHTNSPDYPLVGAFQTTIGGGTDGFISKLNAIGSAMVFSSFLGGVAEDRGLAIAVGSADDAYVTGDTESFDFPTANPVQGTLKGSFDAFAAKIEEPRPEILLRLEDNAPEIRVLVSLGNASDQEVTVDMRLWIESALLPDPISLRSVPVTLPASLPSTQILDFALPGILPFPGTRVGTRLLDTVNGEVVSESLCPELPCN